MASIVADCDLIDHEPWLLAETLAAAQRLFQLADNGDRMIMMIRRMLCLVLVGQLLLIQLLVCHCHPDTEGEGACHGSLPHIHLSRLTGSDSEPQDNHDHDADAVYLATDMMVLRAMSWTHCLLQDVTALFLPCLADLHLTALTANRSAPPPLSIWQYRCPIFLIHLTLLI